MNILSHAKNELNIIGMLNSTEEMNVSIANHILYMIEEFSKEGHSGYSASYTISILEKLLNFKPLSPLTGEDSEWCEVMDGVYQNNRCFNVFRENGKAYDSEGIIFYDVLKDEDGNDFKSYFTNKDSRKNIEFPYIPSKEYKQRPE